MKNALIYKFLGINIFALAVLSTFIYKGWVQFIFAHDVTYLTTAMFSLFCIGILLSLFKILKLNKLASDLDTETGSEFVNSTYHSLVLRYGANIQIVKHIGTALVMLGIGGTVVGLIIALTNIDPVALSDATKITPIIAALFTGIGVKLYVTLTGIVLNIWTTANYFLLSTSTQNIISRILEFKEKNK